MEATFDTVAALSVNPMDAAAPRKLEKFEDHIGIIHMQAKFGYKWAQSAGQNLDYEDMFQEASIAFLLAAEGYDASTGLKFSTYFTKVAFSQFRRAIGIMTGVKSLNVSQREEIEARRQENSNRGAQALPLLPNLKFGIQPVEFSGMKSDDAEGYEFIETLSSDALTPEQHLEYRQNWDACMETLSPVAQLMVDWLINPPEPILQELEAQDMHAEMCRVNGDENRFRKRDLTIANVAQLINLAMPDITHEQIMLAKNELARVVKGVEKSK